MFRSPAVAPAIALLDIETYHIDVHNDLLHCMNRVFVRGCEAEYLDPMIHTEDFCPKPAVNGGGGGEGDDSGGITPALPSGFGSDEGKQNDVSNGENGNTQGVAIIRVRG